MRGILVVVPRVSAFHGIDLRVLERGRVGAENPIPWSCGDLVFVNEPAETVTPVPLRIARAPSFRHPHAHVRFRGGAARTLRLALPLNAWQLRQTDPQVLAEIDRLLENHTDAEVVAILNERGLRPGQARSFSRLILFKLRQAHDLDDRYTRLRRRGLLTQEEMAVLLGVCVKTVKQWRYAGLLRAQVFNDKGSCLYEPPDDDAPRKSQGRPLRFRRQPFFSDLANEVQCSA